MTVQFAMDQTGRLWRVYNDTGALEMSRVVGAALQHLIPRAVALGLVQVAGQVL